MAEQPEAVTLSGSRVTFLVRKDLPEDATPEARRKFEAEIAKSKVLKGLRLGPGVGDEWLDASARYFRVYVPGQTLEEVFAREEIVRCEGKDGIAGWAAANLRNVRTVMRTAIPWLPAQSFADYLKWIGESAVAAYQSTDLAEAVQAVQERALATYPNGPSLGFSHGDLAFDNIIVTPNGIWFLIDPLYNPYDCPQWDLGKILQSTYVNWPALKQGKVEPPPPHLLKLAELMMEGEREDGLLFLFYVLLRIIRHAKSGEQKEAIVTESIRIGREYVGLR
jgi:hypothetical protein